MEIMKCEPVHKNGSTYYTICRCNCGGNHQCVIKAHVKDGKVVAVEPDDRYNLNIGREDAVLPDVGIELKKVQGDEVQRGQPLCLVHGRDAGRIDRARSIVQNAYSIGGQQSNPRDRVLEEIRDDDLGKV